MKSPRQNNPAGMSGGAPADEPAGNASAGTSAKPSAGFVAEAVSERFQKIQAVLAPVLGPAGVVALYERSRHLSGRSYPWLAPPKEGWESGMDLEDLKSLVAQQSDEAAAAGAAFLLKSFHDLLAGLVGGALTRQLLGAAPSAEPSPDKTQ
jgi:hypothetical protein